MLRFWDYECEQCGAREGNVLVNTRRVPKTVQCKACGARAGWARQRRLGQIHRSISSLYGRRTRDPQTGARYESYEHKMAVMRQQGRVETEVEKIDDILADDPAPTGPRDPNVRAADTPEEVLDHLHSDPRVDRKRSGDVRTEMLDSWGSFEP